MAKFVNLPATSHGYVYEPAFYDTWSSLWTCLLRHMAKFVNLSSMSHGQVC